MKQMVRVNGGIISKKKMNTKGYYYTVTILSLVVANLVNTAFVVSVSIKANKLEKEIKRPRKYIQKCILTTNMPDTKIWSCEEVLSRTTKNAQ